jgi:hypothetical protein
MKRSRDLAYTIDHCHVTAVARDDVQWRGQKLLGLGFLDFSRDLSPSQLQEH